MELQERTTYSFCPCGKSQKQPFCDGSHKEVTQFKSLKFTMLKTETVELCMCKYSKTLPFCDHKACNKNSGLLGRLLGLFSR